MIYQVTVKDEATYALDASEYSKEGAINEALNWFDERKHAVSVNVIPKFLLWAVVNPDGTFAGAPCESEEEARELACQQEGRWIFQMTYDPNAQILWD